MWLYNEAGTEAVQLKHIINIRINQNDNNSFSEFSERYILKAYGKNGCRIEIGRYETLKDAKEALIDITYKHKQIIPL